MKAPPYPPTTLAKGWRFELDHEAIDRSDTWSLTPTELRPWLLMLWLVAWKQSPCGSLPNDDELIAAHIGMPIETFKLHRRALMRRWWEASDGRLYHDVVTRRVLEMLAKRERDAARTRANRAKQAQAEEPQTVAASHSGVTRDTGVTHTGVAGEFATSTSTRGNTHIPTECVVDSAAPSPVDCSEIEPSIRIGRGVGYAVPPCPKEKIVALYHARCVPPMASVAVLNAARQKRIIARWRDVCIHERLTEQQALEVFDGVFARAAKSKHLTGRNTTGWRADFDWLLQPGSFVRVVEGYWDGR